MTPTPTEILRTDHGIMSQVGWCYSDDGGMSWHLTVEKPCMSLARRLIRPVYRPCPESNKRIEDR